MLWEGKSPWYDICYSGVHCLYCYSGTWFTLFIAHDSAYHFISFRTDLSAATNTNLTIPNMHHQGDASDVDDPELDFENREDDWLGDSDDAGSSVFDELEEEEDDERLIVMDDMYGGHGRGDF